jgi:hypothetical protein
MVVTLANNAHAVQVGQPNLLVNNTGTAGVALEGALIHTRDDTGTPTGPFSFLRCWCCVRSIPRVWKDNKHGYVDGVVHSQVISKICWYFSLRAERTLLIGYSKNIHKSIVQRAEVRKCPHHS